MFTGWKKREALSLSYGTMAGKLVPMSAMRECSKRTGKTCPPAGVFSNVRCFRTAKDDGVEWRPLHGAVVRHSGSYQNSGKRTTMLAALDWVEHLADTTVDMSGSETFPHVGFHFTANAI